MTNTNKFNIGRLLFLWFFLGEQYFVIEGIYRVFRGERAHIAMLFVGVS